MNWLTSIGAPWSSNMFSDFYYLTPYIHYRRVDFLKLPPSTKTGVKTLSVIPFDEGFLFTLKFEGEKEEKQFFTDQRPYDLAEVIMSAQVKDVIIEKGEHKDATD